MEEPQHCVQKYNSQTLLSKEFKVSVVCEKQTETNRDRGGRRRRLLYWPITSSLDPTKLCYLQGLASSLLTRRTQSVLADSTDRCKLRLTQDWHSVLREHLHISFHNTHTFPFNLVTASTYFHRCVLCRESLIDGSVKGQICNSTLHSSNPPELKRHHRMQFSVISRTSQARGGLKPLQRMHSACYMPRRKSNPQIEY